MEVFDCPLIMSGTVELRIIRQTILDGASDYRLRVDETVGFVNYQAVFATRLLTIGCPVILDGFAHYPNLLRREMSPDKLISFRNYSGVSMMILPTIDKTEIMECRYDINHIGVYRRSMLDEFQTLLDYHTDMVLLMRFVKGRVSGNNLPLHIVYDFRRDQIQFLHIIVSVRKGLETEPWQSLTGLPVGWSRRKVMP